MAKRKHTIEVPLKDIFSYKDLGSCWSSPSIPLKKFIKHFTEIEEDCNIENKEVAFRTGWGNKFDGRFGDYFRITYEREETLQEERERIEQEKIQLENQIRDKKCSILSKEDKLAKTKRDLRKLEKELRKLK